MHPSSFPHLTSTNDSKFNKPRPFDIDFTSIAELKMTKSDFLSLSGKSTQGNVVSFVKNLSLLISRKVPSKQGAKI
jgi:hypothetical protein